MSHFLVELDKTMFKIIAGLVVETRLTAISSGYFSSFSFAAQSESTECATRNVK